MDEFGVKHPAKSINQIAPRLSPKRGKQKDRDVIFLWQNKTFLW